MVWRFLASKCASSNLLSECCVVSHSLVGRRSIGVCPLVRAGGLVVNEGERESLGGLGAGRGALVVAGLTNLAVEAGELLGELRE